MSYLVPQYLTVSLNGSEDSILYIMASIIQRFLGYLRNLEQARKSQRVASKTPSNKSF